MQSPSEILYSLSNELPQLFTFYYLQHPITAALCWEEESKEIIIIIIYATYLVYHIYIKNTVKAAYYNS